MVSSASSTSGKVTQRRNSAKMKEEEETVDRKKPGAKEKGEIIKNGKRYLRLIGRDYVRDVLIQDQGPNVCSQSFCPDQPLIADQKHMEETSKQKKAEAEQKEREERGKESVLRKKELESFPVGQTYGPLHTRLERESMRRANHLLHRVQEMRKEQTDEVKTCNTFILSKKCQAIRDAQVAEKKLIQKEQMEEDDRLYRIMEQERFTAEYQEEMRRKKREEDKKKYRDTLLQQIRDNEIERQIIAEKREKERKCMSQRALEIEIENLNEVREKLTEQARLRDEINRINQDMTRFVAEEQRETKLAELRVQECIRRKVEEEERREEELRLKKQEKERSLAKMRSNQQQLMDKQTERDQKEAKRIQDQVEMKWRAKELEAREERARRNRELEEERRRQTEERRTLEAAEVEEDRKELARVMERERMNKQQERLEADARRKILINYREALLKQINEKEKKRLKEKQQSYEDGFLMRKEHEFWKQDVEDTMRRKIGEIRTHNIPENYIKDLERKLLVK